MESSILLGLIMFAIGMFLVFIIVWLTRDKEEKKENKTSPTIELTPIPKCTVYDPIPIKQF